MQYIAISISTQPRKPINRILLAVHRYAHALRTRYSVRD